jgi:hypothetical protein
VKGLSLDTETRDLQELCTCLARHWPLVRQSDKPYDQIFSYLSEKVRLVLKISIDDFTNLRQVPSPK